MNGYRELLAVNQDALKRIRAYGDGIPGWDDVDVRLLLSEVERVIDRLEYWEDVVDQANWRLRQPA